MTATRTAGLVAGALVALVAGLASYTHMRQLAAAHGETWLASLLPLSVDGLLVVASLVIVTARRGGAPTPRLAWLALVAGVVASLAANVAAAGDGLVAKLVAAWPPAAFAVTFELLLRLVRAEGLSTRAIAAATGTSAMQASRDIREAGVPNVTPEPDQEPGSVTGLDGKTYSPRSTRPDMISDSELGEGYPERLTPGDDDLVHRARHLVATHGRMGRARLARELGCSQHQARQILATLAAERPALHAVGGDR